MGELTGGIDGADDGSGGGLTPTTTGSDGSGGVGAG